MVDFLCKFVNVMVVLALGAIVYSCLTKSAEPVKPPQDDPWFQTEVVDQPGPVLVKFGAPWCGPCRMLDPELDKLSASGGVTVVRVEVDEHRELAQHYGVSSIPRLLLFDHGKVVADRVGYADSTQLQAWIGEHMPIDTRPVAILNPHVQAE
jgi:thioredoxin